MALRCDQLFGPVHQNGWNEDLINTFKEDMRILAFNSLLIFLALIVSECIDIATCYQYFSDKELRFVAYENKQLISFLDTNNVVQTLHQTKYRREMHESCGSIGCSGEHKERYEIEYQSTTNPDWGFMLNLNSQSCKDVITSYLFISSDNLKSYKPDRWIFEVKPDSTEIKYDSMVVNGGRYYDVFEFSGYHEVEQITMVYNHEFGIIQIAFPRNKTITRLP